MEHKVWYDEEHGVVRQEIIGIFREADIPEYFARCGQVMEGMKSVKILIDFTRASRRVYESMLVRERMILGSLNFNHHHERLAVLAPDPKVKLQAAASAKGAKDRGKDSEVAWFEKEEDALRWLQDS